MTADATGISPTLLALAVALGYAGGVGGARRTGEDSEAATALLLVAALAARRGPGQRRVRVRRRRGPAAVRHAARPRRLGPRALRRVRGGGRSRPRSRSAARGRAIGFDPDAAPRSACAPAARTWRCLRSWRSPRWRPSRQWARCWWARCSCSRPRPRGCSPAAFPGFSPGPSGSALARGSRRALPRLLARRSPGPADRRARRRRVRRAGARRGARRPGARRARRRERAAGGAEGLSAGYGGPPALASELRRERRPVGLRAGAQRRRQDDALPRSPRRAAPGRRGAARHGPSRLPRADRPHPPRLPCERPRRGAHGHALRGPLVAPAGSRGSGAAARGAHRVGLADSVRVRSASCQGESAAAPCWPGRWCRTRPCCCSTSRSPGWTRPAPSLIAGVFGRAARRGAHAARVHPRRGRRPRVRSRALPNRRQVAFGPPAEVLTGRRWRRPTDTS